MKKLNFLLALMVAFGFVFSSCSDDENGPALTEEEQLANEQNAAEEDKIPVSTLSEGIIIEGATINDGTPPTPNSDLNFNLSTDKQEAFQGSGFTILFTSTDAIEGAYIVFKDVDGTASDSYFDVPYTSFNGGRISKKTKKSNVLSLSNSRVTEDGIEIDIDFGAEIPAGQFCYDICLYDAANNVSQAQTVCVTVEAWGGNASIVGEWIFDRYEPADIEENNIDTLYCTNDNTLVYDYSTSEIRSEWTFALNQDGSYFELYDDVYKELDYQKSITDCELIYSEEQSEQDKYSGFWAFNEEDQSLTVVDFKYEDLLDPLQNEEYEDGSVYLEGVKAEVINDQLVLTDSDDGELYKLYFNRK